MMENQENSLSFKKPLIYFGIFVFIVAVLTGILALVDRNHKNAVYNTYAAETNSYIDKNRGALVLLFTQIFPDSQTCYPGEQNSICMRPNGNSLAQLLPSTLKDWSSTSFIKKVNNKLLSMRLSGDVSELYIYDQQKETLLYDLLDGKRETILWDKYTNLIYNIGDVIIPVKDENNKILGAIVRGVIE